MKSLHNEAHVWFVRPERERDPSVLQYCHAILDSHERDKFSRFVHADDSHCYLISHAMVRSVLSRYTDTEPSDWRFGRSMHGRPEIISNSTSRLRFNLTHTAGLAACVVTLDDDCGIDAEQLLDRHNPLGIAKRMFSVPELEQLMRCEGPDFLKYFYEHWTLREAYVKARGIGLSIPTRKICFKVTGEKISAEFDDSIGDHENDWHFRFIETVDKHVLALALRHSAGVDKHVRLHHFDFNA